MFYPILMKYSLLNIFSFDYWFNLHPILFLNDFAFIFFLVVSLSTIVLGSIIFLYVKKGNIDKFKKNFLRSVSISLIVFGTVVLIWVFFRYQNVYVLSMRIWFILIIGWFGYKIYSAYNDYQYKLKKKEELKSIKSEMYKYIPKKKKSH